jgi:hypothetical protein
MEVKDYFEKQFFESDKIQYFTYGSSIALDAKLLKDFGKFKAGETVAAIFFNSAEHIIQISEKVKGKIVHHYFEFEAQ